MQISSDAAPPAHPPVEPLLRVIERIVRGLRAAYASGGLSLSAASALLRLAECGPQGVTELARLEGVSQPAMTQLVARLDRDGLVLRAPSDEDRRVVLVDITDRGTAALASRRAARTGRLELLLASLSPDERDLLAAAVPVLERLADAAIDTPVAPTPASR